MKRLKKGMIEVLKFLCMFVVLGMQTILQGSWSSNGPNQKAA
ncbi:MULTISPECIES: hypothetical protein [Maribacter]|uniref:Uncharacterized protein n=1 Tax=Maribacter flavus TaxID=1658664 RepID=A0ABU7IEZ6_9FLAO|nr:MULTISPECIES: hypothetical protein [Maribacter]MDC6404385.1 hypothetical protein [Maribacter sp. PR66]MEE1971527.1 hypothetical protein [Maribacter flavus]